jgi:hypothetical protein
MLYVLSSQTLSWALELITRGGHEAMLSVACSVGKVLLSDEGRKNPSDDQTVGCLVTDFSVTGIRKSH